MTASYRGEYSNDGVITLVAIAPITNFAVLVTSTGIASSRARIFTFYLRIIPPDAAIRESVTIAVNINHRCDPLTRARDTRITCYVKYCNGMKEVGARGVRLCLPIN